MAKKTKSKHAANTFSAEPGISVRQIVIGLGIVAGAAWCAWLLASMKNAVTIDNTMQKDFDTDLFSENLGGKVSLDMPYNTQVVSRLFEHDYCISEEKISNSDYILMEKIELRNIILDKLMSSKAASRNKEFNNKFQQLLVDALVDLHESGKIEQCKIDALLSWDKFKIEIITTKELSVWLNSDGQEGAVAFYNMDDFIIRIPQKMTDEPRLLQANLSHEMQHAIDHYDNLHNLSSDKKPSKFNPGFNFGKLDDTEEVMIQAYHDVMGIIENDLQHINRLDETLDALAVSENLRNSRETKLVATLGTEAGLLLKLIIEEQYRPLFNPMGADETVSDKERTILNANPNVRSKGIGFFGNRNTYISIRNDNPTLEPVDLNACKSIDLAKNLIFKIKRLTEIAKGRYAESRIPSEFGAYMSQILSQYPGLESLLLPEFSTYRVNRASPDRANCLRGM